VTVEHAVQDYDAWRPVFDEHRSSRREHGCTSERVHRAVDHPKAICIVMTSPSAENEQAFRRSGGNTLDSRRSARRALRLAQAHMDANGVRRRRSLSFRPMPT
jgi:hypothetical protein